MALELSALVPTAVGLIVAAIAIGMGAKVLVEMRTMETNVCSSATLSCANSTGMFNSTTYGINSMQTMASFIPTIAVVGVAAIIIGIVVCYFR